MELSAWFSDVQAGFGHFLDLSFMGTILILLWAVGDGSVRIVSKTEASHGVMFAIAVLLQCVTFYMFPETMVLHLHR